MNLDDLCLDESSFLQNSVSHLQSSGIFIQSDSLPNHVRVLEDCLLKSNQNIFELKESLKLVLDRENSLQNDFNVLMQRYEFTKHLYKNKELSLVQHFSMKSQKSEELEKKMKKIQEKLEKEEKNNRDLQKNLTISQQKLSAETEKSKNFEVEFTKCKNSNDRLLETIKSLNEEASNWKEKLVASKNLLELKEKEKDLALKKAFEKNEEFSEKLKKDQEIIQNFEKKEKKWIEIYEERKISDSEIRAKLEEAKMTFKELEKAKKDQDEELHRLRVENKGLKHRAEGLENEINTLKKQSLKEINEKIRISDELEKIHSDLASREGKLKEMSERREKYIKDLENQNSFLSSKITDLQHLLKKHETLLDQSKQETNSLKQVNNDLNERLSKEQEEKTSKSRTLSQLEDLHETLTLNYQTIVYNLEQSQIQLRALQTSMKKSEESYESEILRLRASLSQATFTFEEKLQRADHEKSRVESELKKTRTEYSSYENNSKKAHSEIELWKAGLLEVSLVKVLERPKVEDLIRALLGVAPERLTNYDLEQAEYVAGVVKKIKDVLFKESTFTSLDGGEALERTQVLLQEVNEKYRKEMAERRRLHALLQDLRGNIRVMCRVRPLMASEKHFEESITVMDTCQVKLVNLITRRENWFEFDRVFPTTDSQEVVYYEVSDMVTSAMNGFNVCIMAYGQTGSGKTYTMEGTSKCLGINFRAVREIFEIIESRVETHKYSIELTILEVYNEQVRDLLNPSGKKIEIREDAKGNMHLPGVEVSPIKNYNDLIKHIEAGKTNRSVGCTNINEYSSRSHCIVTIYIHCSNSEGSFVSKLNLIDLAGSERICKSEAEGIRMVEACNINQSLSALGKVLYSLAGKQAHIPYRDSKLTHLLRDSLSGDAKTLMIITVNPSNDDVSETLSSLTFGSRVACVEKGKAKQKIKKKKKKNVDVDVENVISGISPKISKKF
jgi:hypothetical protein